MMERKIALFALFSSIVGLAIIFQGELSFNFRYNYWIIFEAFNLRFFGDGPSNMLVPRVLNLFFYSLLFVAAFVYLLSRYRESRLLRFVFSVVLASKVILMLEAVIKIISYGIEFRNTVDFLMWVLFYVIQFAWIYLAYRILIYFNRSKAVLTYTLDYYDYKKDVVVEASFSQRMFHVMIDMFVLILVFSSIIEVLIRNDTFQMLAFKLQNILGERVAALVIVLVMKCMYYVFFETLIGATPAKLLTETRVTDENGVGVPFKTVFARTLSRFVPFEPLSFMNVRGWHDKWSDTYVVMEQRTGVKGGYYFLIIPLMFLLFVGGVLAGLWYI